jgi:hypothetical protein
MVTRASGRLIMIGNRARHPSAARWRGRAVRSRRAASAIRATIGLFIVGIASRREPVGLRELDTADCSAPFATAECWVPFGCQNPGEFGQNPRHMRRDADRRDTADLQGFSWVSA